MSRYNALNVKPRQRIFVAVEGSWEQSFVKWLSLLCDQHNAHLHLDVANACGGDPLAIVECAVRDRKLRARKGPYIAAIILLDDDQLDQNQNRGTQALQLAQAEGLDLMFQHPNFEGLMLQLHAGYETRRPPPNRALPELQRVWPEFEKRKVAGIDISQRFTIEDLRRAGNHNNDIARLRRDNQDERVASIKVRVAGSS